MFMTTTRAALGLKGEQAVVSYLCAQQCTIMTTNFRVHGGEVDIIAKKDNVLMFVEVKTRNNPLIDPAEVITTSKQKKIMHAAQFFLITNKLNTDDYTCRFDVALVSFVHNKADIAYIPDAFQEPNYV